jgi:hypothetical protein
MSALVDWSHDDGAADPANAFMLPTRFAVT